jgi:chaperonin GroES
MSYFETDHDENYLEKDRQSHVDAANIELLKKYADSVNIAEELDKNTLSEIGNRVCKEAAEDDDTRTEWFDRYNEALKIAKQTIERKSYPFENAANVKIPLILQGCIQFNSRVFPEIVQNGKAVQAMIMGTPRLEEEQRAFRIGRHMSYQTVRSNWYQDTDRMLMVLPLVGTVFRKWNYDSIDRCEDSYLCLPTEIIVNNDVPTLEDAARITHVIKITKNQMIERIRAGVYRDINLFDLENNVISNDNASDDDERVLPSDQMDSKNYYVLYEQHNWMDLDGDGYAEPYIVTVLKRTRQVLRIYARYDESRFVYGDNKKLIKINPCKYFVAHHFLPSPDGTFLGVGFGQLLLQLNTSINTIINNLIDAATLANIRGGYIGNNLRISKGDMEFVPGEWKIVNLGVGQRLSDSIYPLPISEPSQTLFSLLNFLVDFGKQVANINDVLMGTPMGMQAPATSVVTMVEQGTKIYSSILIRLYESLRQEFNILFEINQKYFDIFADKDKMISSGFVQEGDYDKNNFDILPVANPALGVDAVRLAKMQVLMQLENDPMLNRQEIVKRYLDVLGIPNPEKLFNPPPPPQPPSPEDQKNMAQAQLYQMQAAEIMMEKELKALELQLREKEGQADVAFKGGQLANQKMQTIAQMSQIEASIGQPQIQQAKTEVEGESKVTGTMGVDYSQLDAQLQQNTLTAQQASANVQGGGGLQGSSPMPTNQPPTAGGGAPQLPPQLDAALKAMSQESRVGAAATPSAQGAVQAQQL